MAKDRDYSARLAQVTQFAGRGSDGVARLYSLTSLSHTNLLVVLGIPESSSRPART